MEEALYKDMGELSPDDCPGSCFVISSEDLAAALSCIEKNSQDNKPDGIEGIKRTMSSAKHKRAGHDVYIINLNGEVLSVIAPEELRDSTEHINRVLTDKGIKFIPANLYQERMKERDQIMMYDVPPLGVANVGACETEEEIIKEAKRIGLVSKSASRFGLTEDGQLLSMEP